MTTSLSPAVRHLTTAEFDAEIATGTIVVDFWAPWCGPCHAMGAQLELAARLRPRYRFAKVNVDQEPPLAQRFGVRSIPTLGVWRDGRLLSMGAGVVGARDLVAALDAAA